MLRWVSVAPFGRPVVPLVNWMLIASVGEQRRGDLGELRVVLGLGEAWDVVEVEPAGPRLAADLDHGPQVGQRAPAASAPGKASGISGARASTIADVVAGLEALAATRAFTPTLFSVYSSSRRR